MKSRPPWFTSAVLALLAIALGVAGTRLARRMESIKLERDSKPLRDFEDSLHTELDRLDALYAKHVGTIASDTPLTKPPEIKAACHWLVGLRQFSLIPTRAEPKGDPATEIHVPIDARVAEILPEPTFFPKVDSGLPRKRIVLSTSSLLADGADHGWQSAPGNNLLYWQVRGTHQIVVLLLDTASIRSAINQHLTKWSQLEFAPVKAAGGTDALLAPGDRVLAGTANPQASANMLLPLRTRFGTWHLASWDQFAVRESYHLPTLLGGAGLCGLLLGLAGLVFVQQRNAYRLASQRVSFVNSVSHELRTPLTNMLLNLDLVAEQVDEAPARRLDLVREEAGRLGRLIENVLTFSRSEQGKLTLRGQACRPGDIVDSVLAQFAPGFERRQIIARHERCESACVLPGDALAQVAANLLSNVEKYAPGCEVVISTRWENEWLALRVADTGPGIPPHSAERIFRPFERLDSRVTEGASGTGLGLAIARDLARQMGGTLTLVPAAKGATFELRVPAPAVPALKSTEAA